MALNDSCENLHKDTNVSSHHVTDELYDLKVKYVDTIYVTR